MLDFINLIIDFFVSWILPETEFSRRRCKEARKRNHERYPDSDFHLNSDRPYETPLESVHNSYQRFWDFINYRK